MSNVPSLGLMVVPYSLSSVSLLTSTLPVLGFVVVSPGLVVSLGFVVVLLSPEVSSSLFTVTVQETDSSPTAAVITALPLASAVTSPEEVTLATVGSLLLHATVSSVPLTFRDSLSPMLSTSTVRFREMVGVTTVSSGVAVPSSGVSTLVMGGFSLPSMASLIRSPKMSHTTSTTRRISTTTATGPRMLGARRLLLSAVRRPRPLRALPL